MGGRKEYTSSNARIPILSERLTKTIDNCGGISKVSSLTGISRNTITFWCQGARTPDAANLITISKKLGISVDWLLGLTDTIKPDMTIRGAMEITGLSEHTIEVIRESTSGTLSKSFDYHGELDSFLSLNSSDLAFNLSQLHHAFVEAILVQDSINKQSAPNTPSEKEAVFDRLEEAVKRIGLQLYYFTNFCREAQEKLIPANELLIELQNMQKNLYQKEEKQDGKYRQA